MIIIFALMLGLVGGVASRWHGGGYISGSPKSVKNLVWALPIAASTASFYESGTALIVFFVGLLLCIAGKALGHGRGFRLKEPMKSGSTPERVEAIIPDKLPLYWYKVSIMALTGLAAVSGGVVALMFVNPLAGVILAIGGVFKGLNAMVFDLKTEYREFADGFAAYFFLMLAYGVADVA